MVKEHIKELSKRPETGQEQLETTAVSATASEQDTPYDD